MSYSQCGEDVFIYNQYFKNKRDGVFIELGALDGKLYSNTKMFEDVLNWSGILIEPHPLKFQALQVNRPKCFLFNDLVSCISDEVAFRYFLDGHAALSGVENTIPKSHFAAWFDSDNCKHLLQNTINIKPKSLTEIITSTNIKHIDFLSLDVEGHEYEVLKSWDFSFPIDVILIEIIGVDDRNELCRQILVENGYIFDGVFAHNEIFIRK